jgi:glycosyltransferase involved in cell wall biosynthesis
MPLLSVVIPVFNRAGTVRRAVDSVLAQVSGEDTLEVIVVDDGSSDDLGTALESYCDRIRLIRHQKNAGAAAARNTGVANARGAHVAFLDSDDVWLPGKVVRQMADIRRHGWRASCTAFFLHRQNGRESISPKYESGPLGISDLVWGCFVSPGSTLIFERSLFSEIGPLDAQLGRLEDWDWLIRYAQRSRLGFLAEPLARIEASVHRNPGVILASIAALRGKHATALDPVHRRRFAAALDCEAAAARYRGGQLMPAFLSLSRSLSRVPFGNKAIQAVLHNRSGEWVG